HRLHERRCCATNSRQSCGGHRRPPGALCSGGPRPTEGRNPLSDTTDVRSDVPNAAGHAPTGRRGGTGLWAMLLPELQSLAGSLGITGTGRMRKGDLIAAIQQRQAGEAGAGDTATTADQPRARGAVAAGEPREEVRAEVPAASTADSGAAPAGTTVSVADGNGSADGGDVAAGKAGAGTVKADPSPAAAEAPATTDSSAPAEEPAPRRATRPAGPPEPRGQETSQQTGGQQAESREEERTASRGNDEGRAGKSDDGRAAGRAEGRNGRDGRDEDDEGSGGSRRSRRNRYRDLRRGRERGGDSEPQVSDDDVLVPVAGIVDVLDNYAF